MDAGPVVVDAGAPDAGTLDACEARDETCNLLDDDCDGSIDETPAEATCRAPRAITACVDGGCVLEDCEGGFEDCNGELWDGCEIDIENDPRSCGACDRACAGTDSCRDGVCDRERVVQITAGNQHACAVRRSGEALCWGGNESGQLGTGDRAERLVATPVAGGRTFVALVAAFDFSCGILTGGGVACWGANPTGQLGDGSRLDQLVPVDSVGPTAIVELASAAFANGFVLARSAIGEVWGWGDNQHGQLAVPRPPPWPPGVTPPILTPVRGVVSLSAATGYACAVFDDATLDCWGVRAAPSGVDSRPWRTVHAGQGHTCGIDDVGDLFCWGRNTSGAVGPFPCMDCPEPQRLPFSEPVANVAASLNHTCALLESGAALCWGFESRVPVAPPGLGRLDAIVLGLWGLICALDVRARVWCWGGWRVGDGTSELRDTPVEVLGLYPGP